MRMTLGMFYKSEYGLATLSQKFFVAITLAIIRKRIRIVDSSSQAIAKHLLGAILRGGEFGLDFCVVYAGANMYSRKSSTTFRQ